MGLLVNILRLHLHTKPNGTNEVHSKGLRNVAEIYQAQLHQVKHSLDDPPHRVRELLANTLLPSRVPHYSLDPAVRGTLHPTSSPIPPYDTGQSIYNTHGLLLQKARRNA